MEKQGTEANWGTFTSFKKKSQKLVQRGGSETRKEEKAKNHSEVNQRPSYVFGSGGKKKKMFISSIYGFLALVGG